MSSVKEKHKQEAVSLTFCWRAVVSAAALALYVRMAPLTTVSVLEDMDDGILYGVSIFVAFVVVSAVLILCVCGKKNDEKGQGAAAAAADDEKQQTSKIEAPGDSLVSFFVLLSIISSSLDRDFFSGTKGDTCGIRSRSKCQNGKQNVVFVDGQTFVHEGSAIANSEVLPVSLL